MLWIVAAPGESLTPEVAKQCEGHNVIAVNDAYERVPFASILYASDREWWSHRRGCPDFAGVRWTVALKSYDNAAIVHQYKLNAIKAHRIGDGFCFDPGWINLGKNSGFQAVNLAIHSQGNPIIMVGFDMKGRHFFGDHKPPLRHRQNFPGWIREFNKAAEKLPPDLRIINATPRSALTCFPIMTLTEALALHESGNP